MVGHQNHIHIHCMFFAICPNYLHLVHFVVLLTVPPSAADLYLLFLGLPAALFRIGGHNLNPGSTLGHCLLSVIGFTLFS